MVQTSEDITKETAKMKDSALGEDEIRLHFINKASKEIQGMVVLRSRICGILQLLCGKKIESRGESNCSF